MWGERRLHMDIKKYFILAEIFINKKGLYMKNEFNLPKDVGIMPEEEILIVNVDKEINEIFNTEFTLEINEIEDINKGI